MVRVIDRSRWLLGVWIAMGMAGAWAKSESAGPFSAEIQALVDRLDHEDLYLRQQAFVELEALRDPSTAEVILAHVTSRDPNTRAFSVRALAAVLAQASIPTLLERWKRERHPYVRSSILIALEPFWEQEPAVVATAIQALRDRKRDIRMVAVDVVSHIDRPEAREALAMRWKRERDRDVRRVLESVRTHVPADVMPE